MKAEKTTESSNTQDVLGYQVIVTGIKWDKKAIGQYYVKNDRYVDLPS